MPQCMHLVFLVIELWSFPQNLNVEEEQGLGQNDSSVNIFVFPAPKQEKIS